MTRWEGEGAKVEFVDFCRLTSWMGWPVSEPHFPLLAFGCFSEKKGWMRPRRGLEVLEKPAGRNRALGDSGSSSREKRETSREEEEGLSQQGRG